MTSADATHVLAAVYTLTAGDYDGLPAQPLTFAANRRQNLGEE